MPIIDNVIMSFTEKVCFIWSALKKLLPTQCKPCYTQQEKKKNHAAGTNKSKKEYVYLLLLSLSASSNFIFFLSSPASL